MSTLLKLWAAVEALAAGLTDLAETLHGVWREIRQRTGTDGALVAPVAPPALPEPAHGDGEAEPAAAGKRGRKGK